MTITRESRLFSNLDYVGSLSSLVVLLLTLVFTMWAHKLPPDSAASIAYVGVLVAALIATMWVWGMGSQRYYELESSPSQKTIKTGLKGIPLVSFIANMCIIQHVGW